VLTGPAAAAVQPNPVGEVRIGGSSQPGEPEEDDGREVCNGAQAGRPAGRSPVKSKRD
jgi:hypothetical protein